MSVKRSDFVEAAKKKYASKLNDGVMVLNRSEIQELVKETGLSWPGWLTNNPELRLARGEYRLRIHDYLIGKNPLPAIKGENGEKWIPTKTSGYVPFGNFDDLYTIVNSGVFYPVFVTGMSGNGKTLMVQEICARLNREMIRANITIETDEDDLLGGLRLIDGETIWQDGPVITAMKRGAILLLDEVDLASNKIMCLQPILEGNPIFIKKINQLITPARGFNIIATANTKGKGSDDGRFVGTMIMNEAFLERYSVCMEQEYPNKTTEIDILNKRMDLYGIKDTQFTGMLVEWAGQIRKAFEEGTVNEIISTRRLVHIVDAYRIFDKNRSKSMTLCLNRFDKQAKDVFFEYYTKIDTRIREEMKKAEEEEKMKAMIAAKKAAAEKNLASSTTGKKAANIPF